MFDQECAHLIEVRLQGSIICLLDLELLRIVCLLNLDFLLLFCLASCKY